MALISSTSLTPGFTRGEYVYIPAFFIGEEIPRSVRRAGRCLTRPDGRTCGSGDVVVTHLPVLDLSSILPSLTGNERPFIGFQGSLNYYWTNEVYCDGTVYVSRWRRDTGHWMYDIIHMGIYSEGSGQVYEPAQVTTPWNEVHLSRRLYRIWSSFRWDKGENSVHCDEVARMADNLSDVLQLLGATGFDGIYNQTYIENPRYYGPNYDMTKLDLSDYCAYTYYYGRGRDNSLMPPPHHVFSPLGEGNWIGLEYRLISLPYLYDCGSLALFDLYGSLPESQVNMIANVLDIINTLHDMWASPLEVAFSAQDAYLSYRYSYSTTKMDIEETVALLERLDTLSSSTFKQYGQATRSYRYYDAKGSHIARVHANVCASFVAADFIPKTLLKKLKSLGLRLSFANAWDMVPYSFMVDWFLPIGEVLNHLDLMYREMFGEFNAYSWVTSFTVEFENEEGSYSNYCRRLNYKPAGRLTSAFSGQKSGNVSAWYYHLADTLAIFRR